MATRLKISDAVAQFAIYYPITITRVPHSGREHAIEQITDLLMHVSQYSMVWLPEVSFHYQMVESDTVDYGDIFTRTRLTKPKESSLSCIGLFEVSVVVQDGKSISHLTLTHASTTEE